MTSNPGDEKVIQDPVHFKENVGKTSERVGQTREVSDGGDLSQLFLDSLADGVNELVIHAVDGPDSWTWDQDVTIDTTNYAPHGVTIRCVGAPVIEYGGDGTMIFNDTQTNISGQVEGGTFDLYGGVWKATGDPDRMYHQTDSYRCKFYPKVTKDWYNSNGNAAVCEWQTVDRWCENNFFGGKHQNADRGLVGSAPNSGDSMQDNYLDSPTVGGVRDVGFDLSGAWLDSTAVNPTVLLDGEGSAGFRFNGSMNGMVVVGPEMERGGSNVTAYEYRIGPDAGGSVLVKGGHLSNGMTRFDTTNASTSWNVHVIESQTGSLKMTRYGAAGDGDYRMVIRENGIRYYRDSGSGFSEMGRWNWNGNFQVTNTGSSGSTAVAIGQNGAGFYVDSNGDLVAVSEDGTETIL